MYHFADDTNLFRTSKPELVLVNCDNKHLNNWLSADKISIDVEKTDLVRFKSPRKLLSDEMKIKRTEMEKGCIH